MNFIDKYLEKLKGLNKKDQIIHISSLVIIVMIIIIGYNILTKDNNINEYNSINLNNNIKENNIEVDYSTILERRLNNILTQIKGVGKVNVMVTIDESIEKIPAKNINQTIEKTNEVDSEGGKREVTKEDYNEEVIVNNNQLAVIKNINPKIKGVIIVAEGVEDVSVKEKLYTAVKTVLGISGNRVEVYCSK